MTQQTIKSLVSEWKPDVVEVCRPNAGQVIIVGSGEYNKAQDTPVADFQIYTSKLTGKTHMKVVPKT